LPTCLRDQEFVDAGHLAATGTNKWAPCHRSFSKSSVPFNGRGL